MILQSGRFITPKPNPLVQVRSIANYQFEEQIGNTLFPDGCRIEFSKRSGQIRRISLHSQVLATLRASDGRIVLTFWGAQRLHRLIPAPRLRVVISQEFSSFINAGKSVFAKHVLQVDPQLRSGDEALIVDDHDTLLAVGKAHLSPREMLDLTHGVAVKTRHHFNQKASSRKSEENLEKE